MKICIQVKVTPLEGGEGVNLSNFGRDLKPDVKVILDLLKRGISCWDRCLYFIVPGN